MKDDHPIHKFWSKCGWKTPECPTIDEGLSEAKLAKDAWNQAVEECIDMMERVYYSDVDHDFSDIEETLGKLRYEQESSI